MEFSISDKYESQKIKDFKKRCLDFLIESVHQVYTRFPFNSTFVQGLKHLSFLQPDNIKKMNSLGVTAAHFPSFVDDVNELDREYR